MKKLIYIFNIIIHSEPNQPIKLHNINPEITKENNIPAQQVIDEVLILIIYNLKIDSELALKQTINPQHKPRNN